MKKLQVFVQQIQHCWTYRLDGLGPFSIFEFSATGIVDRRKLGKFRQLVRKEYTRDALTAEWNIKNESDNQIRHAVLEQFIKTLNVLLDVIDLPRSKKDIQHTISLEEIGDDRVIIAINSFYPGAISAVLEFHAAVFNALLEGRMITEQKLHVLADFVCTVRDRPQEIIRQEAELMGIQTFLLFESDNLLESWHRWEEMSKATTMPTRRSRSDWSELRRGFYLALGSGKYQRYIFG